MYKIYEEKLKLYYYMYKLYFSKNIKELNKNFENKK